MAVEVEQSHSGRLQAVLHDRADALHELVAEERVLLAGFTNRPAAKREGVDRFDRVGVELPAVGREQPRDAEQLACLHGVDDHGAALWYQQLERHPAAVHQEEAVGRLALVEQVAARLELHGAGGDAPSEELVERANVHGLSLLFLVADGADLLGQVDADWAPGDAAATAHAAGGAELVDPGTQLVREPLAVAGPGRGAHAASAEMAEIERVAGVPAPPAFGVLAGQVGGVLHGGAEAGRADHGAVAACQAAA